MGILNYSTGIKPEKTVAEIGAILGRAGASAVQTMYEDGAPSGVGFSLKTPHGMRSFELPVNVDGVFDAMKRDKSVPNSYVTRAQAQKTAWRIVKDWVAAQIALVQAGQAQTDEVMLPYMLTPSGETVYRVYEQSEQKALEAL
jgi:hypothetical protein